MALSEHTISLDDMDMYYQIHGTGSPLLLLHGFTGTSTDWAPLIPELKKQYQLIIPDLRGHGRSTHKSPTYTFRQVAQDLFALLDHLKIHKVKGIGCSGGGNTLLHMAFQQPERLEAMVLVSATSHYPEQARSFMEKSTPDNLTPEHWDKLRKQHVHGDAQIRNFFTFAKAFATDSEDMNFSSDDLAKISSRTLLVQGDRDFLYPLDITIEMYKAIPQASLWVIPNAGHVPIMNDLDYFTRTALTFLQ